jgi:hypothetical protein
MHHMLKVIFKYEFEVNGSESAMVQARDQAEAGTALAARCC